MLPTLLDGRNVLRHPVKAITLILIVTMLASCATVPGRPDVTIFPTFQWCFGVNLAAAVAGGAVIAILMEKFVGKGAGIGSGVATAAALSIVAWHVCAGAHSKTTTVMQRSRDETIADKKLPKDPKPTLVFEEFVARVDQDAKLVNFDLAFMFIADLPDEKDIPITIWHKLEIVQMVRRNDKLLLVDATREPILDGTGRPIPVKAFATVPEQKIAYQTFYEKKDKEIIQQGLRKITHELPAAIKDLEYPLPLRYTAMVEAGRFTGEQTVAFYLPDVGDRPKIFAAKNSAVITKDGKPVERVAPVASAPSQATPSVDSVQRGTGTTPRAIETSSAASNSPVGQYVTQKIVAIYESAGGAKVLGRLQINTLLDVYEFREVKTAGPRAITWLRVSTKQGLSGWVRKGDVVEVK